ncbi:MAG: putative toxin-antitoxin system toxin component, PIN family [Saprospiraceae bacterium]
MRVVLDINVLLVSLPIDRKYRPIFDALKSGRFKLLISNEILTEYEEKIAEKTTRPDIAQNVVRLLLNLPNVEKVDVHYRWNLITNDPDDNKYTDCAIAANATFVVSDDSDFRVLKRVQFPNLVLLTSDEFLEML